MNITNTDKLVGIEVEHFQMQQYLMAMQESTTDILYRVDVATMTLYHFSNYATVDVVEKVIPDYVNVFIKEQIVHPEDVNIYLHSLEEFNQGRIADDPVRFCLSGKDYQWYKVTGKRIYDNNGNVKEVFGALVNVHDEYIMKEEFSVLNQYFQAVQSLSGESLYTVDIHSRVLQCQGIAADELGLPPEVEGYPECVYDWAHPEELEEFKKFAFRSLGGTDSRIELRIKNTDGKYRWYELISMIIRNNRGEPIEILGKIKNIHDEHSLEESYSVLNQYFSAMQKLSEKILFRVDVKTKTLHHLDENILELGMPLEVPNFVENFIENGYIRQQDAEEYRICNEQLLSGKAMEYEIQMALGKANCEWFSIKGQLIHNEKKEIVEVFGTIENIQWKKELEVKASLDLMTQVLNKVSFEEEVSKLLSNSLPNQKHALVFVDLDDFKGVNDTLGHAFGDAVLIAVGKRLKKVTRGSDLVGRVGGDEFVVLLRDVENDESVLERTNLILETLQRKFTFKNQSKNMKASLGVSIFPEHGKVYSDLIVKSDLALYASKGKGKNMVTIYKEEL